MENGAVGGHDIEMFWMSLECKWHARICRRPKKMLFAHTTTDHSKLHNGSKLFQTRKHL
jgi:hypothetical protein